MCFSTLVNWNRTFKGSSGHTAQILQNKRLRQHLDKNKRFFSEQIEQSALNEKALESKKITSTENRLVIDLEVCFVRIQGKTLEADSEGLINLH